MSDLNDITKKALVIVTTVGRIVTGIIATTVARCRCKSVFYAVKVHFVHTCFRFGGENIIVRVANR